MASTYSTDLKLELQATGENASTWGTKTNNNLNLLQQAISGYQAIDVAAADVTLVMTDASISNARNMVLKLTGTLAGNRQVLVPDSIEKFYIIQDSTTHASFTLTFKTVSGTGFTLEQGLISAAFSDGTNITAVNLNTLSGTLGTAQIDDDAITNTKIADNAVDTDQIAADAVTNAKVAADAVDTTQLVNDAVTAAKLERKFTISTAAPSGGSDGDIWFKYS
ncbi:MAG: hypothetical protein O3C19_05885 [Bacteroidetes bacterium]|nr:hypothetical protein [Bacteroidota bacterium]